MSRTSYTDNLTISSTEHFNQTREIKANFGKTLAHIDYMLFKIEAFEITQVSLDYRLLNTVDQLRKMVSNRLLDFANADTYRDIKVEFQKLKN
jgi:hypothetical protein